MALRYWVGNGGNWSDATNHWSNTSGGIPGAGNLPLSTDNVFFDANSFSSGSQTVTINVTANCKDMDWTGVANTPTLAGSSALNIYGGLTLVSGMTATFTGSITFLASGPVNITLGGQTLVSNIAFLNSNGTWSLQDAFNIGTRTLNVTSGHFDTNNNLVTVGLFLSSGVSTRTITLGSSVINVSDDTGWDMSIATNLTLNAGTSVINITGTNARFSGGGKTYNNVTITGAGLHYIIGTNTFSNLTVTGTATKTDFLALFANQTITGTLSLSGNSSVNRLLVRTLELGITRTLTANAVSLSNVDFNDITGAGSASPFTGTSLGDAQNNSGITFTTPVVRYWVATSGGSWSSTSSWSASSGGASGASVPLCHDTVYIDANSITSTGRTVSADMVRLGRDIDFTGVLNTPKLSLGAAECSIYGDLKLVSGMTSKASFLNLVFAARDSVTFTTGGITVGNNIYIQLVTGVLTLSGNLIYGNPNTFTLNTGTFDANGNNVTGGKFDSNFGSGNNRTLSMGAGTWTLNGTRTVWNMATITDLILNESTSTIDITNTTGTLKTFAGGGEAYNNLTVSGDNVTISGPNVFNTLALNNGGLPTGTRFTSGITQTLTSFSTNGSSGSLAIMFASTSGSSAILSKSSGIVSEDYMQIKDSYTTGGASWFAGLNSIDNGGNSGWSFTAVSREVNISDTVTITEVITIINSTPQINVSDSILITEISSIGVPSITKLDSISVTESISVSIISFISIQETITVTEKIYKYLNVQTPPEGTSKRFHLRVDF